MHRRQIAFPAPHSRYTAEAANRDGARRQSALGEHAQHRVERDAVAPGN